MSTVLLLNGPNLNLLGKESLTCMVRRILKEIESNFKQSAVASGLVADCIQSNSESILIESVHTASSKGTEAIVINPGAYGHTSVALRDAFFGDRPSFCGGASFQCVC